MAKLLQLDRKEVSTALVTIQWRFAYLFMRQQPYRTAQVGKGQARFAWPSRRFIINYDSTRV
jgi:hypothetical protein